MRLEQILAAQARRHPDKPALICGDERTSYAELNAGIARLASGLQAAGIRSGDRVVLFLPNGVPIVELFYAAFALGALVVPVTTRLTAHEIGHICQDSRPAAIAFEGDGAAIRAVLDAHPDTLRISVATGVSGWADPPPQGGGGRREAPDGGGLPGRTDPTPVRSFASTRPYPEGEGSAAAHEPDRTGDVPRTVTYWSLKAATPAPLPRLPAEPEDALIMYTSGTTGKPKGALITHSNITIQHAFMNAVEWEISHRDVFLVTTPLAHRTGFARLGNALSLGATLVVMSRFDPRATVETIAREQVTVAGMVPTVCRMVLPEIEADPSRCASLRRIVVTGEAFPVELKRRLIALLPDVKLVSFFAMTEAGGVTSLSHDEQFTHAASVGRPTPGVEIRLVGDNGADVPEGEPGELWVRVGAPGRYSIMRGYYNRPDDTVAAFEDSWFKTGDMGRLDPDGYLFIVDRKKDMILSGGFNIYCKEVEQALVSCPGVADAAVVGVPDPIFGESVVAFIERLPVADPTPAAIIEHARTLLAGYKKPKTVFVVDALPRNSLGKVLKRELRDEAIDRMGAAAASSRPAA